MAKKVSSKKASSKKEGVGKKVAKKALTGIAKQKAARARAMKDL